MVRNMRQVEVMWAFRFAALLALVWISPFASSPVEKDIAFVNFPDEHENFKKSFRIKPVL